MNNISNINYKSSYSFSESNYNAGKCGSGHTLSGDIPQGNATYDAARKNMGEPWMMFTKDQGQELIDNTTSEWTSINGVNGRKFTSKTDSSKYIFLPSGGFCDYTSLHNAGSNGCYWSITYNHPSPALAWLISISSNSVYWGYTVYPFSGLSIRLVRYFNSLS